MKALSPILGTLILISIAVVAGTFLFAVAMEIVSIPNKLDVSILESRLIKVGDKTEEQCFLSFELLNTGNLEITNLTLSIINTSGEEVFFQPEKGILNSLIPGNVTLLRNPPYLDPDNSTAVINFTSGNYCKAWQYPDCQTYPLTLRAESYESESVTKSILECSKGRDI